VYECGAQVGDSHVPRTGKKDVFWLEITVHDAHVVKSIETECLVNSGQNLSHQVETYRRRDRNRDRNPQFELSIVVIAH